MNLRSKGRRRERQAKQALEDEGWIVEITKIGSRFEKNKDFFNLFDLIAIKKNKGKTITKWIQVKSNRCPKEVITKIKAFKDKYLDENNVTEVWIWKDYKGFLIKEIS